MAQRLTAGLTAAIAMMLLASSWGQAAELTLKRVVLSTGGVGYLEYEATVEGNATLALDVPLDQVDDVLKSLVVYDSGGSAGEITLPGREALTQTFADLPFDRSALNSAVDLLNALQGSEIRVAAPQPIEGRLIHAEREPAPAASGGESRTRISVMTAAGLQQFALQDVGAIAFTDPALQRQVGVALSRIATYRAAGRRELSLHVHGNGSRLVRVGYVVAMPLWKASYRLSLPAEREAASARLQGWAVLENFSGRAWQDVELTLLSGNPVTFRQALYESYYVPRPSVPVESGTHVLPPPDSGTVGAPVAKAAHNESRAMDRAAPAMAALAARSPAPGAPPPPPAPLDAGRAAEEATQISFIAPDKVTVAAGQSLVLPLLDRAVRMRRVDLYDAAVDRQHPLAAVELRNDGATGLPPGVLTLYQQNPERGALYLGDARLAPLPAGDKRLLSYAIDNKVTIGRDSGERRPVVNASIAEGVMHIHRVVRWTTEYRVKAIKPAASQLLIEQLHRPNAILTAPDPNTVERTERGYRIPSALPEDGTAAVAVSEEQPVEETIKLLDLDDTRLGAFVSSTELDPKLRQALGDIAGRRQALARRRSDLTRLKERRAQLVEDERRLRDNLSALGSDPALKKRLLDKFTETETAIDAVSADLAKANETLAATEADLAAHIAGLKL